eukprot:jgi/Mesen1/3596/ME000020S03125
MATGWLRGVVKSVPSGDSLTIMGLVKSGPPPEKTITLSSLIAPKLARRDTRDEPFAWNSREYLRKKCIGKEVTFKVDYVVPSINREFGSVFLGDTNLAIAVVSEGWAKVRPQIGQGESSPYLAELHPLEEQAKTQAVGMWTKEPGAAEASVRDLPASGIGQDSGFDSQALLDSSKGRPLPAIVRDGSTLRVLLLPGFQFVQVYVAGTQAPSMGRRAAAGSAPAGADAASAAAGSATAAAAGGDKPSPAVAGNGAASDASPPAANGAPAAAEGASAAPQAAPAGAAAAAAAPAAPASSGGPLSAAQRLAASTAAQDKAESEPEPFAREAKHFTETRCLNRDVRVVLEGVDGRFNNLIGSVHYPDGDTAVDLSLQLVSQGLARVVEWSANMLEPSAKARLKAAELEAKKARLKMWTNFVPPVSNNTAVRDDNFTGKAATHKARAFLPFLQKVKRLPAVVDYVLSGHRVKLLIPKEMCAIAFSLSGVRCPGRGEPFSEDAIAFMRRKILQHDVEIEVETVDKTGTFLGSLYEAKQNVGVALLEAGLAKLHPSFAPDRTPDGLQLQAAETRAKNARLKVQVTEVLGGGKVYLRPVAGTRMAAIEAALKELELSDKPAAPGSFQPKKGDLVVAQFSADDSFSRALIVNTPRPGATGGQAEYEVFYIDYGNQEPVPLSRLRPVSSSAVQGEGLALLASLAHVKVPEVEEDFGVEAAEHLASLVAGGKTLLARVEERDTSGGRARAQGQGPRLLVTLVDAGTSTSVNAGMLQAGLAKLEKSTRRDSPAKAEALAKLREHQDVAKKARLNIWQYGDVESDDEDDNRRPASRR